MNPETEKLFNPDPDPETERIARKMFEEIGQQSKALNKAKEKKPLDWAGFLIGVPIGLLLVALVIFYGAFAHGFVGYKLWQWFMVPLGLPVIGMWHAYGISLVVRLFTYENPYSLSDSLSAPKETSEKLLRVASCLAIPWFILLVGYIIKLLI